MLTGRRGDRALVREHAFYNSGPPWRPVVRTPRFHCSRHGFHPWSGNEDPTCHAAWPTKNKNKKNSTYTVQDTCKLSYLLLSKAVTHLSHVCHCALLHVTISYPGHGCLDQALLSTTWLKDSAQEHQEQITDLQVPFHKGLHTRHRVSRQ